VNWQPSIPLAEIAEDCIARAARLQRALRPSLERRPPNWIGSMAEFYAGAVADYKREFGHSVSARHIRALIERTLRRDGGAENFARVELFLDDRLRRDVGGRAIFLSASESDFAELQERISSFTNPAEPSSVEEAVLWCRAIELFNSLVESGRDHTRTKYALLSFLWRHAPRLAKTPNALRVMFDRRLAKWVESEGAAALRDGRELRKGVKIAPEFPQQDIDIILGHTAWHCGGRLSQGVRECVAGKAKDQRTGATLQLTAKTVAILTRHDQGKSYVPHRLRELLTPMLARLRPQVIGGRYANNHRCTGEADYSANFSDDLYTADDVTMPVEVYMRDATGEVIRDQQGKAILVRGQVLLFADVRSRMVLGFSLQPERQYSQWGIRTNAKNVMSKFAVPRFWLWEKNIWQRGKLLTGGTNWRQRTNDECQEGLHRFGCRFIFTPNPQGKAVMERIAGLLQDKMESIVGYVGREERVDKPQHTKNAERAVAQGGDPSEHFYEFNEWHRRLEEIIDEYNHTKQEGAIDGLSPIEAYGKFQNHENPPMRYSPEIAWRLSYDSKPMLVTKNGIRFEISGERFIYCGEAISHLVGREVLVHFDPEDPSTITVTDRNERNPITIERFIPQSPTAAYDRPEEYRRELAKVRGQDAWPKITYRTMRATFEPAKRGFMPDAGRAAAHTVKLGAEIGQQRAAIKARQTKAEANERKVQRLARETGMPASILGTGDNQAEYLEMMRNALNAKEDTNA